MSNHYLAVVYNSHMTTLRLMSCFTIIDKYSTSNYLCYLISLFQKELLMYHQAIEHLCLVKSVLLETLPKVFTNSVTLNIVVEVLVYYNYLATLNYL